MKDEEKKYQKWWHTLPGMLTALAAVITAITGLIVGLSETGWISHENVNVGSSDINESSKASKQRATQPIERSTDTDYPMRLTSPVIEGFGIGEPISHYYTFYGGPGLVSVTAKARNQPGYVADALRVEVSKVDGISLATITIRSTDTYKTELKQFPLGRREPLMLRVDLDPRTVDYRIELSGAVSFE